jgi:hypothetical protein
MEGRVRVGSVKKRGKRGSWRVGQGVVRPEGRVWPEGYKVAFVATMPQELAVSSYTQIAKLYQAPGRDRQIAVERVKSGEFVSLCIEEGLKCGCTVTPSLEDDDDDDDSVD